MSNSRIQELVEKINKARHDYYNGVATISDSLYDAYIAELSTLDPRNLAIIGIGSEPVSKWEKYTHLSPMGSLNKTQTNQEYQKWHDKYIDKDDKILATLKLDGLSVSLIYEDGILVKAATRGSGVTGELITQNVAQMMFVPLRLSQKINATVRGEILLSKENHKKYFPEYSNTRNAASGISRRYDGSGCDKLSVLTYQILTDDIELKTQEDMFSILNNLGFKTPPFYVLSSYKEVIILKDQYQNKLRDEYDYSLDGMVIHNNDLEKQAAAGSLDDRPYASIAMKFDSIAKEATISDIIIMVGNSGRLTPVAVFNPKVELVGAQVEKASLHNYSNIVDLGIDVGCKVLVCRSNDVIPYVEEVTESTGTVFSMPNNCPVCGAAVIQNGEYLQCSNTEFCPSQIKGRILNWIKELNILEWGESLVSKLVDTGKVRTVADLYKLTVDDLASIDRMGKKSAQKCYDLLWENSEISLDVFLGALSIQMIGSSTIRQIIKAGCDTLEKFGQLNASQFEMVSGVGPVKAESLEAGLKQNQQIIMELLENGVKIKKHVVGKLSGKSIAFTGTMVNKRAILEKMAIDAGADVKSSVGKGLSYLVINDLNSQSSKAVSARKFGTTLVSEDDFLQMVK